MTHIAVIPNLPHQTDKYFGVMDQRPKQESILWT